MKITVEVYGPLRGRVPGYDPDRGVQVEIPGPATVKDLLARLNIPIAECGMVTVNLQMAEADEEVPDGAAVVVLPFVGGG